MIGRSNVGGAWKDESGASGTCVCVASADESIFSVVSSPVRSYRYSCLHTELHRC
jgi:hypothetical protein